MHMNHLNAHIHTNALTRLSTSFRSSKSVETQTAAQQRSGRRYVCQTGDARTFLGRI